MIHVLSGKGITNVAGVIRVSYPANSTLVVKGTSSGKQFAKDTNTTSSAKAYIFLAPIGNASYTLTATNSAGKTVSKQVYVAKDQVQSVVLAYEIHYYDAGDQYISVTGGWKKVNGGNGGGTLTLGKSSMVALANFGQSVAGITTNKINLSNIKTLTFNVNSTISGNAHCVVTTSQDFIFENDAVVATVALNTSTKTYTLNTSSLTGSYYIAFGIDHGNELANATVTVLSIYGKG